MLAVCLCRSGKIRRFAACGGTVCPARAHSRFDSGTRLPRRHEVGRVLYCVRLAERAHAGFIPPGVAVRGGAIPDEITVSLVLQCYEK